MAAEKIGVYICHCGTNIAGKVDVDEVTALGRRAAQRRGGARVQVHVLRPRPGAHQEGHRGARHHARRRGRLLADHARAHLPQGGHGRRPQPVPAADGQHPRALLVGDRRRRGGDRRSPSASSAPRSTACPSTSRSSPSRCRSTRTSLVVGGGIAGIEAALKLAADGQEGLPGRARPVDRRAHGDVRQDLPHARLRGLHPHPEDVGGRQGAQHRDAGLQRGHRGRGLRRQLQGQGAQEAALRRHRQVHRLRPLHRGVCRAQGPERVRPGA